MSKGYLHIGIILILVSLFCWYGESNFSNAKTLSLLFAAAYCLFAAFVSKPSLDVAFVKRYAKFLHKHNLIDLTGSELKARLEELLRAESCCAEDKEFAQDLLEEMKAKGV